MTIRQKLFSGFIAIAILIGVVSFMSVNAGQKALKKSVGENFVMLAEQVLSEIDKVMYHRIEQVQIYAKDMVDEEMLIASNRALDHMGNVQEYIEEKDREWSSVPKGTVTPFMLELIDNDLSDEIREELILEEFYRGRYGYMPFVEVFVTNKYGVNVAQTQKTSDYFQADEVWWQKAREDGLFIGDIAYDESSGVYSTDISIRIDDAEGNFSGIIKAVLNIEEVINVLKEGHLLDVKDHEDHAHDVFHTLHSDLLTQDGKIIYSDEHAFLDDISGEEYMTGIFKSTDDYFMSRCDDSEDEELFAHVHSNGYKSYKGLGWILMLMAEKDEVFAPVDDLRNTLIVMSLGIMILAVIGSSLISRSIAVPISELKDAAAKIGKGDLDVKIEVKSKDEIGFLAASIKKMTGDLKKSQDELASYNKRLEKDVEERTKELEEAREALGNTVSERTAELYEKLGELERFRTATIDREFRIEELNMEIARLKGKKEAE